MSVRIQGGQFVRAISCFQSGPYEEDRRDRLRMASPQEIQIHSFTSRVRCYAEDPTKSVVLELDASPDAELSVQLHKPSQQAVSTTLRELFDENLVHFMGVFTSESFIIQRLVGPDEYSATVRWTDRRTGTRGDWYYLRVTQSNGHLAWSSPIWVG